MARPKSSSLTSAELRLMDVLWLKGPSSVAEVADALPLETGLAYSTVLTTLRILEDKGYLKHEKQGRAFIYSAAVERETAQRSALTQLLTRFFGGKPELLVQNLLDNEELSEAEIHRLRELIAKQEGRL